MTDEQPAAPNIELYSRNGFAGPNTTIVRAQYLPRFARARGTYVPRRFHTWELADSAFADPRALPVSILQGAGISIEVSRHGSPQTFGYMNAWADELHYVISGRAQLDTQVGTLDVRPGDLVLIPRGVSYRWGTVVEQLREVIVATESELRLDPADAPGTLNPDLYVDRAVPHGRPAEPIDGEYEVVMRHGDEFTSYFYDFDPIPCLDVVGAPLVLRVNLEHVHGLSVDEGGLPPARLFGAVSGRELVFGLNSRRSDRPPVHHNADFDEVIFYAGGPSPWGSVDTPGTITWTPRGVPHQGPAEDVTPGYQAWLLETRSRLSVTPAGTEISHLMETDQYDVHPSQRPSPVGR
jgi:homogentisate 1,2-dioxygenase